MQKINTVFILSLLSLSIYSLSNAFIYRPTPCFYITIGGPFLFVIFTFVRHFKIRNFYLSFSEIVISGFIFITTLHSIYVGRLNPAWFLSAGSLLSFYLLMRRIKLKIEWLIWGIVIIGVTQAVYSIGQSFHWFPNVASSYRVSGSFDNPAGLAAMLAITFPFSFILICKRKTYLRVFGTSAAIILFVSIILSGSRAGLLAVLVILSFWFSDNATVMNWTKPHKILRVLATCVLIFFVLVGLYFMKKDSADGRLLIWQNSFQMVLDKPLLGHGAGGFMKEYMVYQADFFQQHPSSKFVLLADNVTHTFNELLLLLVEHGMVGMLFLVALTVLIIRTYRKQKSDIKKYAMYSIIGMMVFANFSYPLNYPVIRLMMVLLVSISMQHEDQRIIFTDRLSYAIKLTTITLCIISFGIVTKMFYDDYKWNKTAKRSLKGETVQVLSDYERLYKTMNQNNLFLYNYAAELNFIDRWKESNKIMDECTLVYNDSDIQMILADNYQQLKQYKQAEECLTLAHQMTPNRFVPLYKLALLYEEDMKYKEALLVAQQILEKQVKVNSTEIIRIQHEMRNLIVRRDSSVLLDIHNK